MTCHTGLCRGGIGRYLANALPGILSFVFACVAVAARSGVHLRQLQPHITANSPRTGKVATNPRDGLKYVWIPPGEYTMGCSPNDLQCSPSEKPSHQVIITNGFWVGQTEVTVGAYERFAAATSRQMPFAPPFNEHWSDLDMPMININWLEAQAYCSWAGGRLPSEAEWEYAARAGDTRASYGELDDIAWYAKNSGGRTHEVAQKLPNGFGLYDTIGNVWEWVNDWFDEEYYQKSPHRDPRGPAEGKYRALRGGSWFYFPRLARVSVRLGNEPDGRVGNFGVRCVANLPHP